MKSFIQDPVIQHFIDACCMMLLHSLWQGMLFAFAGGAWLCTRSTAKTNYRVLLVFCVLFLCTCSLTFWWYYQDHALLSTVFTKDNLTGFGVLDGFGASVLAFTSTNGPLIFVLWLLGAGFCAAKLSVGLIHFNGLGKYRVVQPPEAWEERVVRLCRILGVSSGVRLLESAKVNAPMVLGHFKPVILFPIGLLARLPIEQVEAILLHELAHVRRHDYLVNLLQNVAEALFFYNPGFLLLSNWLRIQREDCCDDIAIRYTPNKGDYLNAVVDLKGHVQRSRLGLAFTGNKSGLFNRVSRMLGRPYSQFSSKDRCVLVVSSFVLIGCVGLGLRSPGTLHYEPIPVRDITVKQSEKPTMELSDQLLAPRQKIRVPLKKRISAPMSRTPVREDNGTPVISAHDVVEKTDADQALQRRENIFADYRLKMEQYHRDIAQYKLDMEDYRSTMEDYDKVMKAYNKIHFPEKHTYPND